MGPRGNRYGVGTQVVHYLVVPRVSPVKMMR